MDERRSRQHWLDAGFTQLAAHGPDGLSIMAVARELGVTKGSFYWHFRDLDGYRAALLQQWEVEHTQRVIEGVELSGGDARARLARVLALPADGAERLALALRSWALADPAVRRAVKRVDAQRIDYVASLYGELGCSEPDARLLAALTYHALSGRFIVGDAPPTPEQADRLVAALVQAAGRTGV